MFLIQVRGPRKAALLRASENGIIRNTLGSLPEIDLGITIATPEETGGEMVLKEFLIQKKLTILKKWFDRILLTYPEETQKFLEKQKDPFANPVGATILEGIEGLYDELLEGGRFSKASFFLDNITRIRAVQDFSPSVALAFIPFLKRVVRDELPRDAAEYHLFEDLGEFESRIDQLTLLAFDIYTACREKLYEIRINEIKNRSSRILERLNSAQEKRQQTGNR